MMKWVDVVIALGIAALLTVIFLDIDYSRNRQEWLATVTITSLFWLFALRAAMGFRK